MSSPALLVGLLLAQQQQVTEPQRPEPAPSVIHVSVTTSLDELVRSVDSGIPREDIRSGAWTMLSEDRGLKWEVRRSPLSQKAVGPNRFQLTTTLSYWAEGCSRKQKPWPLKGFICPPTVSCQGAMEVMVPAAPAFTPEGRVVGIQQETRTRVLSPCHSPDPFDGDITRQLPQFLESGLSTATKSLEGQLSDRLKKATEQAWYRLQAPIELTQGFQLHMTPTELRATSLRVEKDNLLGAFAITAQIRALSQPPASKPFPLPDVSSGTPPAGFQVLLQEELDYGRVSSTLAKPVNAELAAVNAVPLSHVELSGQGGRVLVKVFLSGMTHEPLSLEGRPAYDAATESLHLPDLVFTSDTSSYPRAEELKSSLLRHARWRLSGQKAVETQLSAGLEKDLGENVKLQLKDMSPRARTVEALDSGFRVTLELRGSASVTVGL
jgi:hypothetical protein